MRLRQGKSAPVKSSTGRGGRIAGLNPTRWHRRLSPFYSHSLYLWDSPKFSDNFIYFFFLKNLNYYFSFFFSFLMELLLIFLELFWNSLWTFFGVWLVGDMLSWFTAAPDKPVDNRILPILIRIRSRTSDSQFSIQLSLRVRLRGDGPVLGRGRRRRNVSTWTEPSRPQTKKQAVSLGKNGFRMARELNWIQTESITHQLD